MMKTTSYFLPLLIFLFTAQLLPAQKKSQTREGFITRCNYLLENGGLWEAVNPDYNSEQEWSATHYGYIFEKGYHENFIRIKINGVIKGTKYLFWDGIYFWNPAKNKAEYFSMGTGGQLARGEVENAAHDLRFTVTFPDGKELVHRDTDVVISQNEFHSQSYKREKGKWIADNKLEWKRVKN